MGAGAIAPRDQIAATQIAAPPSLPHATLGDENRRGRALQDKTALVTYDDTKADVKALTTATTDAGYPSAHTTTTTKFEHFHSEHHHHPHSR